MKTQLDSSHWLKRAASISGSYLNDGFIRLINNSSCYEWAIALCNKEII